MKRSLDTSDIEEGSKKLEKISPKILDAIKKFLIKIVIFFSTIQHARIIHTRTNERKISVDVIVRYQMWIIAASLARGQINLTHFRVK